MKREERYELVYISKKTGTEKRCYPRSKAKRDEQLAICKENDIKVISCRKLYPFSTMRNQHNFELIANITYNTMYDMREGNIPWNDAEYDRLQERHDKAVEYECMELPIAWVPWETYTAMKEMAVAAECHRDEACARAEYYRSAANGDYSPGNPWDAPGMSVSDFI